MSRKNMIFDDKKIDKRNFYKNKKLIQIENVNVKKIKVVSKKELNDKKGSFK